MPKRRKNRTHAKGAVADAGDGAPKSFIVKHGQVGTSLTQLVRDMRKVMEPNTATRLRERSRNKLKDYITLAPTLKVSHLLAFTLTPLTPSLRIVRLPTGPTFSFRVERYSLIKDILKASRHPHSIGAEYLSPPLLVLASFPSASPPPHLQLLMKALQSLFPPLAPKTLSLPSARRVVLISYNKNRDTLDFRHYLITVRPFGVSRRVRRIVEASSGGGGTSSKKRATLNLSSHQDVADFLLRKNTSGYDSASSAASSAGEEDSDNAVALPTDYVGRNNKKGQKRAVRLDEIGPRMELRLIKIVEGTPSKEGSVIYHRFVSKSKKEIAKQRAEHTAKEKLRKQRKEEQERNVMRKRMEQNQETKSGHDHKSMKEEFEDEDGSDEDGDEDDDGGDGDAEEDEDEGEWDDEEEISEGGSGDETEVAEESSESEVDQGQLSPPSKKRKG